MEMEEVKDQISKAFEREEEENLRKAAIQLMSARSGKNCFMFHQGKWYHIDRNFNPPKIEEIEE